MAMKQTLGRSQCRVTAKATAGPRPQAAKPSSAAKWSLMGMTLAPLMSVAPARADDSVDSTVDALIGAVKTAADFVKVGISTVESGVKIVQQGYEVAAPVIEQGIKTISPIVEQGAKFAVEAATPAFKAALPAFNDAEKALEASIQSSSLDTVSGLVVDTTSKAITAATPVANNIASFIGSNDPVTLGEYGLGAATLFYLLPPLLGVFGGSLRGFAGEITAAQVLDSLSDGNSILIDIRSQKEKEGSGVPDVPSSVSGRCIEVEFAITEDKKLRGSLRDPTAIEASVTSLQIASLKRVNKGSKIILLDRYGGSSQAVAKELARKGFSKVFTVAGGFDGRSGWVQSKLQIKPAASVLSAPAPVARTVGTQKKALPAPKA